MILAAVSATDLCQLFEAVMFLDAVAIKKYSVKHLYSTWNRKMGNWPSMSQVGYMLAEFCVRDVVEVHSHAKKENEVSIKGHQAILTEKA